MTMAKAAAKSPLLFTIVAVVGVVATGVAAAKGYQRHIELLDEAVKRHEEAEKDKKEEEKTDIWPKKKSERIIEKAKTTWTAWIPTAAIGGVTIASIIAAHKVSAGQIAALSAAAAFGGKKLAEQKNKLRRLLGAERYDKLEAFFTGKKIDSVNDEVDEGLVRFHDQFSGTTVYARLEDVQQVFLDCEEQMNKKGILTFDDYAKRLHIPMDLGFTKVGWSKGKLEEENGNTWIGFKAILRRSDAGKEYYSIIYDSDPTSDFVEVPAKVDDSELIEEGNRLFIETAK